MTIESGDKGAKLCVVGEAPGQMELAQGKPFVGPAGGLLRRLASSAGLNLQDCYITNVFQSIPPNVKDWMNDEDLWAQTLEDLRANLSDVSAQVILAVGSTALHALTNETSITKCRGYVFPCTLKPNTWVIPIIHPSNLLRRGGKSKLFIKQKGSPDYRRVTVLDLRKAKALSNDPTLVPPPPPTHVPTDLASQLDALKELEKAEYLSWDIEVSRSAVVCVGFCAEPNRATVIPLIRNYHYLLPREERELVWDAIAQVLHAPSLKIGQNLLFDYQVLATYFGIRPVNVWCDTMIAHHICYLEDPKGLDYLASLYTYRPYWKDDGKDWRNIGDWSMFYNYNALDAVITHEIAFELQKHIKLLGVQEVVDQYTRLAFGPILKTQLMGVRFDLPTAMAKAAEITHRLTEINEEASELLGHSINLNSPKQIAQALYEELGYRTQYNRKRQTLSTDELAIMKLQKTKPHPLLELILESRKLSKLKATYLDARVSLDGRMRTTYNPCGTDTGRLSSQSNFWDEGLNLQNLPH